MAKKPQPRRPLSDEFEEVGTEAISPIPPLLTGVGDKAFKTPTTSYGGGEEQPNPALAKIKEWNELKEAYENGEATLRDLQNFDPGVLSSNETWMGQYNDFVTQESQAPKTWEEIEEILRRNGYSDDEIQEVKDSIRPSGGEFQGSLVLPGILADLGYEGGDWWDVRPASGQPCTTDDNKTGKYNEDGDCIPDKYQEGDKCPTVPNGPLDGVIKDGQCVSVDDGGGDDGSGDEGADGETPDCTVVTQENAEECGFTIDETGNLVDKDRGDEDGIAPFYTNCGGGIWADPDTECPDVGGVGEFCDDPANANEPECVEKSFQDYVDEVGEDVANTAKGIYEDFKDVITDCVGNPTECIKKIGDKILDAGIPEKCQDLKDCSVADPDDPDNPTYCWKDCVNFNVLAGIPGFPSIPGMQDIGTYRDFEDFLKGIGKDIGEFIEDPAGTLEGWIKGIIDKIKGVFDSTADDASAVIDWLKGIFGAAVGAWVWGQIEEEVTNTILPNLQPYGMCPDGETPKTGPTNEGCPEPAVSCWDGTLVYKKEQCAEPPYGYCQDGTTVKSDASGTNCSEYAEFGYCEDGTTKKEDSAGTNCAEYTPDYGMCDDGLTKKENAEGTNCPGPEPEVNPGDPCDLENEQTGSYQYVGDELQCLPEPPEFGFCQDGVTDKIRFVRFPNHRDLRGLLQALAPET
jgi:hypothetical protein